METPILSDYRIKKQPMTIAGALIAVLIALMFIWQVFLADKAGLPAGYNLWITAGLMILSGLVAIAGISMTLLESITLERDHIRIRSGFGLAKLYGYHEISSMTVGEDNVHIVFKDGRRQTVKNLRLGDGLQLRQLNSFIKEKTLSDGNDPALSILNAPDDKKFLM
jgi:hypothetical protein